MKNARSALAERLGAVDPTLSKLKAMAVARRPSSPLSFAAETIFIDEVIFWIFFVDWIWNLGDTKKNRLCCLLV